MSEMSLVDDETNDSSTDTYIFKWTKPKIALFLQAIKKYKEENEGRIVLRRMYEALATQLTSEQNFGVIESQQVQNKYRRLERSYKEHIENPSRYKDDEIKELPFEEELRELFGTQVNARLKKTYDAIPKVEIIDPDALDLEEEYSVPVTRNMGGFKSFCCDTNFGNLEMLLEHMEQHHYTTLRKSILSKRDLVLKCFEVVEEEEYLELEPKVEYLDDIKEEETPVKKQYSKRKPTTWEEDEETFEITVPKRSRVKKKKEPKDPQQYECKTCKKICIGLQSLKNHEQKHIGHYYCDICAECFFTKAKLVSHFFKHQLENVEDKTLVCMMCEKIFDNEGLVEEHIQEFHIIDPNGFQCESCPEKLSTKFNLISHVTHYHQRKKINCKYCYKSFKTQEEMEKHSSKEHPGNSSNILCTHCGKYFKGVHRFKRHRHTADKPNRAFCSVCKKGFKSFRSCQIHEINVHGLGEAAFTCVPCNRGFATLGDLKNHEVNHSDATPFHCDKCPSAFKRRVHLTSHCETHHSEGYEAKCLICSKELKSKTCLRSHLRKVHRITMNEMYKHAGIPYKGRDFMWSKFLQNRKDTDIRI